MEISRIPVRRIQSQPTHKLSQNNLDIREVESLNVLKDFKSSQNIKKIDNTRNKVLKRKAPTLNLKNIPRKSQKDSPKSDYENSYLVLEGEYVTLKSEFDEITNKCTYMRQQMCSVDRVDESLQLKIEECKEKDSLISELKLKIEEVKCNHRLTEDNLNQLKIDYNNITHKLSDLQNQVDLIQAKYLEMENVIEHLKLENHEHRRVIDDNKLKIQNLVSHILKLDMDRKVLHNTIQNLKGSIRVFCRIRPQIADERGKALAEFTQTDKYTIELLNSTSKSAISGSNRNHKQEFQFDYIFGPQSTQEDIFSELGQLVQSVLDGYNVCVFAYGQTGSGKTFTMEGTSEKLGMIPRTIDFIFQTIEKRKELNWVYDVKASFLEIYNEQIVDLLNYDKKKSYEIRMVNSKSTDIYVTNLTEATVQNGDELKQYLYKAQRNRVVASTEFNDRSSRSHAVTKICVVGRNLETNEVWASQLNLVDLAGSERVRNSISIRLNETKNINKSLSCLGNVILALSQRKEHIPYRDSKLTHLLMPSLGGNSKTLMIVNISLLKEWLHESINSLRFASTVKQCKIGSIKRNKHFEDSNLNS